jgi:hypothetical protein
MITGKINIAKLKHVVMNKKNKAGQEVKCLVIPIESNHLFEGKDGNVYLDIVAFDVKNPKADSKDTHIVKQSLPKEVREAMSEEEKNAMPILGNLNAGGSGSNEQPANAAPGVVLEENDDLPF